MEIHYKIHMGKNLRNKVICNLPGNRSIRCPGIISVQIAAVFRNKAICSGPETAGIDAMDHYEIAGYLRRINPLCGADHGGNTGIFAGVDAGSHQQCLSGVRTANKGCRHFITGQRV